MKAGTNFDDIRDLRENRHLLLLRYRETIGIIVKRFISSGLFHPSEYEDTVQHLYTFFWEQMPKMQTQYNGSCLFRTYVSDILRHECLRLHREEKKRPILLNMPGFGSISGDESLGRAHIRDYLQLLGVIFTLYGSGKPKVLLCLKVFYRIPIRRSDLLSYWPDCPATLLKTSLNRLGSEYGGKKEPEVFSDLHSIIAKHEKLKSMPGSLRRWTNKQVGIIIRLLNGDPPTAKFDRISLGTLFEYFLAPNSLDLH